MDKLKEICDKIREVKIQGATNIAKAAIEAYYLSPSLKTKKLLISLRPTEPTLVNALMRIGRWEKDAIIKHFEDSQEKINELACTLIEGRKRIFTHCHSTNVVKALIYAKKKGLKFEVYNTETRPLFQGRITAKELSKNGIKVTDFVDSAANIAISDVDLVFLGSDAILKKGAINKIGSGMISSIAKSNKKPVYIIADSWKFSTKAVKIEERDFHEVWKNAPKNVKVRDPAFELIEKKYIAGVVSEFGILSFDMFVNVAKKELSS